MNVTEIQRLINEFIQANPRKEEKKKPRSWKDDKPDEYAAAIELVKRGYGPNQIAKHFKVKYNTVRELFKKDGIHPDFQRKANARLEAAKLINPR